jgi:hypothetical protein
MHTVVETPAFLRAAKSAGMSDEIRSEIVSILANDPTAGELIVGTGGLRKFRHAKDGAGKSGGFRVCSYFYSESYPVFLVTAFGKNQKSNLSQTERNAVARFLRDLIAKYPKEIK